MTIVDGSGVNLNHSVLRSDGGNSITGSDGHGINVGGDVGSRASLRDTDTVANNCRNGVNVGGGSRGTIGAHLAGNGRFALFVSTAGNGSVSGIVEGNGIAGAFAFAGGRVTVSGGAARIQGNSPTIPANPLTDPLDPFILFPGGVVGRLGALIFIAGPGDGSSGPIIQLNNGPGILADWNTTLLIRGETTIQSNSDSGVSLRHQSVEEFDSRNGDVNVTDNLGQADLQCLTGSQGFGNWDFVSTKQGCGNNK